MHARAIGLFGHFDCSFNRCVVRRFLRWDTLDSKLDKRLGTLTGCMVGAPIVGLVLVTLECMHGGGDEAVAHRALSRRDLRRLELVLLSALARQTFSKVDPVVNDRGVGSACVGIENARC